MTTRFAPEDNFKILNHPITWSYVLSISMQIWCWLNLLCLTDRPWSQVNWRFLRIFSKHQFLWRHRMRSQFFGYLNGEKVSLVTRHNWVKFGQDPSSGSRFNASKRLFKRLCLLVTYSKKLYFGFLHVTSLPNRQKLMRLTVEKPINLFVKRTIMLIYLNFDGQGKL